MAVRVAVRDEGSGIVSLRIEPDRVTVQPLTTPTGADERPRLDAGMCKCGRVWLMPTVWGLLAEGSEHTRDWCRRLPGRGAL